jgi:2'-hydroxyisoflavone reductase
VDGGEALAVKLLVLGGTKFLGRAVVTAALQAGHEVTLFNRGLQDRSAFEGVEQVHGDRTTAEGRAKLAGRAWDAAVDTAPYLPRDVRSICETLRSHVPHYTLVSSISTMASHKAPGQDEDAPLGKLTPEQQAQVDTLSADGPIPAKALGEFYGPLKAQCEDAARASYANALIVRPGLIVGPFDGTDRFTYWPARFMRGGDVLAPGRPERPVQFIDVRDLAEWMVRMIAQRAGGTYLATGPASKLTFGEVLAACARVAHERGAPPSRIVWTADEKLQDVGPWMELPLWIPASDADHAGFMTENITRALAAGLTFRPLEDTIRAILDWDATRPPGPRAAGLDQEKESRLLSGTGS